jgi:2-polyprenyl-3-methyl-5-hydroxy-6-metoxy-1,4-benzoquinol methylase
MRLIKICQICGNKRFNFLLKQYDKNLNIQRVFSLSKCSVCGALFLNPQPSYKELEEHYSSEKYYSLKKIQTKEESKKTRLKLFLYNVYFNQEKKNLFLRILLPPIKFIVRGTIINGQKNLLDIGCGSGQFLYEMKDKGMRVYGVEPGDFDREGNIKYNLNIKKRGLLKARYPKEYFDLITMNHVLEHLSEPKKEIHEVHRILKKHGTFILGIPNTNSLAFSIFKKNWYQLDIPRHLWNFSNKNLKLFLEKNGFNIKKIRYNSRPSQFSVSLEYKLGIKNRILEQLLNIIFLPLTWLVNSLKIGDQIEVWCVKK